MKQKNLPSAREKRLLMAHLLKCSYEDVFLKNPHPDTIPGFNEQWEKLRQGMPLARLRGFQTFRGLTFHISPHVLEPRTDSEVMLEALHSLSPSSPFTCLDLGVGSGCLLITTLKEFPQATGMGVDISPQALAIAKQNSIKTGVDERATWIESNWLSNIPIQTFDIILSNPPYIGLGEPLDDNVTLYDPHLALYAGQDGLICYRAILENLAHYCHLNTVCLFEIGYQQRDAITELLKPHWHIHTIHNDENGHSRVVQFGLKKASP